MFILILLYLTAFANATCQHSTVQNSNLTRCNTSDSTTAEPATEVERLSIEKLENINIKNDLIVKETIQNNSKSSEIDEQRITIAAKLEDVEANNTNNNVERYSKDYISTTNIELDDTSTSASDTQIESDFLVESIATTTLTNIDVFSNNNITHSAPQLQYNETEVNTNTNTNFRDDATNYMKFSLENARHDITHVKAIETITNVPITTTLESIESTNNYAKYFSGKLSNNQQMQHNTTYGVVHDNNDTSIPGLNYSKQQHTKDDIIASDSTVELTSLKNTNELANTQNSEDGSDNTSVDLMINDRRKSVEDYMELLSKTSEETIFMTHTITGMDFGSHFNYTIIHVFNATLLEARHSKKLLLDVKNCSVTNITRYELGPLLVITNSNVTNLMFVWDVKRIYVRDSNITNIHDVSNITHFIEIHNSSITNFHRMNSTIVFEVLKSYIYDLKSINNVTNIVIVASKIEDMQEIRNITLLNITLKSNINLGSLYNVSLIEIRDSNVNISNVRNTSNLTAVNSNMYTFGRVFHTESLEFTNDIMEKMYLFVNVSEIHITNCEIGTMMDILRVKTTLKMKNSTVSKLSFLDSVTNLIVVDSTIMNISMVTNSGKFDVYNSTITHLMAIENLSSLTILDSTVDHLETCNNISNITLHNAKLQDVKIINHSNALSIINTNITSLRTIYNVSTLEVANSIISSEMSNLNNISCIKIVNSTTGKLNNITGTTHTFLIENSDIEILTNISIDKLLSFNVANNKIQRMEYVTMNALLQFDVSNNKINEFFGNTFSNLLVLNMSRNMLVDIQFVTNVMPKLTHLDLSFNLIESIEDVLNALFNLTYVNLSSNRIALINEACFKNLAMLQQLDLSNNNLLVIQPGSLQLPSLIRLDLQGNDKLGLNPFLFDVMWRLQIADVQSTGLKRIPASLTQSIKSLYLNHNNISAVTSGDFDSYPYLYLLDISNNNLEYVEADALGRCEKLNIVYLNNNSLTKVPKSLPVSLKVLHLDNNLIKELRDDMDDLVNLEVLSMRNNAFYTIGNRSFAGLKSLYYLDLSYNHLKSIGYQLEGPYSLRVLKLAGIVQDSDVGGDDNNKNIVFPLANPERLTTLDLSYSDSLIQVFLSDNATLKACRELEDINFSYGGLVKLRKDFLDIFPQLRKLVLNGNDFDCYHGVGWLIQWMHQHDEQDYNQVYCREPALYHGLRVMDIDASNLPLYEGAAEFTTVSSELIQSDMSYLYNWNYNNRAYYHAPDDTKNPIENHNVIIVNRNQSKDSQQDNPITIKEIQKQHDMNAEILSQNSNNTNNSNNNIKNNDEVINKNSFNLKKLELETENTAMVYDDDQKNDEEKHFERIMNTSKNTFKNQEITKKYNVKNEETIEETNKPTKIEHVLKYIAINDHSLNNSENDDNSNAKSTRNNIPNTNVQAASFHSKKSLLKVNSNDSDVSDNQSMTLTLNSSVSESVLDSKNESKQDSNSTVGEMYLYSSDLQPKSSRTHPGMLILGICLFFGLTVLLVVVLTRFLRARQLRIRVIEENLETNNVLEMW